jgi:anti-sigma B factor antagonist
MISEEPFRVTTRRGDDRLELEGELDLLNAPLLEEAIAANGIAGAETIVLDLRKLTFIDSTGLRTIFAARNEARERGQAFAVTPGSQQVQRLLSITRLGEHLRTIPTPDEALT